MIGGAHLFPATEQILGGTSPELIWNAAAVAQSPNFWAEEEEASFAGSPYKASHAAI